MANDKALSKKNIQFLEQRNSKLTKELQETQQHFDQFYENFHSQKNIEQSEAESYHKEFIQQLEQRYVN